MSFLSKFTPKPAERYGNVDISIEIEDIEPQYLKYLEAMLSHHHIGEFSKETMMRFQIRHTSGVDTLQRKLLGSTFNTQGSDKVDWDPLEMELKAEFLRWGIDPVIASNVVKVVLEKKQMVYKFQPVGDQTGLEPHISFLKGQPTPHLLPEPTQNPSQPAQLPASLIEPGIHIDPLMVESSEILYELLDLTQTRGFTHEDAIRHVNSELEARGSRLIAGQAYGHFHVEIRRYPSPGLPAEITVQTNTQDSIRRMGITMEQLSDAYGVMVGGGRTNLLTESLGRLLADLMSPPARRGMERLGISIGSSGPLTNRNNWGRIHSALPNMLQYSNEMDEDGELRSQRRGIAGISADGVVIDELTDYHNESRDQTIRDRIINGDLRPTITYRQRDEHESESP